MRGIKPLDGTDEHVLEALIFLNAAFGEYAKAGLLDKDE